MASGDTFLELRKQPPIQKRGINFNKGNNMFQRISRKEVALNNHCFVVVLNPIVTQNLEKLFALNETLPLTNLDNDADCIIHVLIKNPDAFEFHEQLDINAEIENPPQGMKITKRDLQLNQITYRYSAEFTMTSTSILELIDSRKSEWKGMVIINPAQINKIENTLKKNLVGVYIDVYNEATSQWDRFKSLELSFETKMRRASCSII